MAALAPLLGLALTALQTSKSRPARPKDAINGDGSGAESGVDTAATADQRRFPPSGEPSPSPGGYVVLDTSGQGLVAYSYSRDNPTEALQAKMLTKDEARRIAVNIARLLELLGMAEPD